MLRSRSIDVDPYEYVTYFISYGTLQYIIHALHIMIFSLF